MQVASGSFLPDDGFTGARPFVVLGSRMQAELFRADSALGARVRIGADRYRVIGVMAAKGQMLGFDLDDTVFIPVGRATEMFDREGVMEIDVTYAEGADVATVLHAIKRLLVARHGQEDFTLVTQDKMLEVLGDIIDVLTAGVAATRGHLARRRRFRYRHHHDHHSQRAHERDRPAARTRRAAS
jgi:putative ABC transport system permease protein